MTNMVLWSAKLLLDHRTILIKGLCPMKYFFMASLIALSCTGCTTKEINANLYSLNSAINSVNRGLNSLSMQNATVTSTNKNTRSENSEKNNLVSAYYENESVEPAKTPWSDNPSPSSQTTTN